MVKYDKIKYSKGGVTMPVPAAVVVVGKAAGAAALTIVSTKVIPKVIDVLSDKVADDHELKRSWVKVPCVIGAKLDVAQKSIEAVGLKSVEVEVNPKISYRKAKADVVIRQSYKGDTKVDPTTTIKLHYISQTVIDESKQLFDEHEAIKNKHKEDRKDRVESIKRRSKETLKKLPLKKKGTKEE